MKLILKYTLVYTLWIAFCYLLMTFYKLTLNPVLWDETNRFVIIMMALFGLSFYFLIFIEEK